MHYCLSAADRHLMFNVENPVCLVKKYAKKKSFNPMCCFPNAFRYEQEMKTITNTFPNSTSFTNKAFGFPQEQRL